MKLKEVGEFFNLSSERIRQIEAKALRKLRHPGRSGPLREFLQAPADVRQDLLELKTRNDFTRRHHCETPKTIEELELSVRGYWALLRIGVTQPSDLPLPANQKEAIVKKYGKRAIADIEECLGYHGLLFFTE